MLNLNSVIVYQAQQLVHDKLNKIEPLIYPFLRNFQDDSEIIFQKDKNVYIIVYITLLRVLQKTIKMLIFQKIFQL